MFTTPPAPTRRQRLTTLARHGRPQAALLLLATGAGFLLLAGCPTRGSDAPDQEGEVTSEMLRSDVAAAGAGEGAGGLAQATGDGPTGPAAVAAAAAGQEGETESPAQAREGRDGPSHDDHPAPAAEATPGTAGSDGPPDGWEDIRLGAPLPDARRAAIDNAGREGFSGTLGGVNVRVFIATLPTGEVTHIDFLAPSFDEAVDEDGLEAARALLRELFGPPTPWGDAEDAAIHPEDLAGIPVWTREGHRWFAYEKPACCGDSTVLIRLQTDDPRRTCGHADGRAGFLDELRQAAASGDRNRVASHLSFPFHDAHSEIYGEADADPFRFEDRAVFDRRFGELMAAGALRWSDDDAGRATCDPHAGVQIYTSFGAPLAIVRTADGWRATGLDYAP